MRFLVVFCFVFFSPILENQTIAQLTWGQQISTTSSTLRDMHFISTTEGWACGYNGVILHTQNAGETWEPQNSGTTSNLTAIHFYDANLGWAVGYYGQVFRTIDGGTTWSMLTLDPGVTFEGLFFYNDQYGWAVGGDASFGVVFYTTDGGLTWVQTALEINPYPYYAVQFISPTVGWMCGLGMIYRTDDGGNTWTDQTATYTGNFESVSMISAAEGWICNSSGQILHTTNGGANWQLQSSGTTEYLWDIQFIDQWNGIVCGYNGVVLATVDGGNTWYDQSGFTTSHLLGNFVAGANAIWVCGNNGEIWRSPAAYNDLVFYTVIQSDALCKGVIYPGGIGLYNQGGQAIESATISVSDGSSIIGTHVWSGFLAPGDTTSLHFFNIELTDSDSIIFIIEGDSTTDNNIFIQSFTLIDPNDLYSMGGPYETCAGEEIEIQVIGGKQYYWNNAGTDTTSASQFVSPLSDTYYTVEVDLDYCVVSDSVLVTVLPCNEVVNAFSPNNDGINDFWILDDLEGTTNEVKIFNRWGDLVNSFTNYDNATVVWNGRSANDETLPVGTYYFTYEVPGTDIKKSGWVQILR